MARMRSIPRWALVLALVLVAGAAWRARHAVDHGEFLSTDERAYAALGLALSRGHYSAPGMEDPLHWPPGTPLLFAVARQVTGADGPPIDPMAAYCAQALVGVALIVVVFALVRLIAGPWPAVAAAAAVAIYPPLAVISGDLVSEPLGALMLALVMLALAWAWRAPSPWRFALAGAATGVAILVRADLLVLPFVLAVVVALTLRRSGARPALLAAGAYLLAAVLAVAPWSAYATSRRHQFTPVTSSSWSTLFVGTYLPADGITSKVRTALAHEARARHPSVRHLPAGRLRMQWVIDGVAARHPDVGRSEALKRETLRNLRRYALGRPIDFAAMEVRKVARMWIGYDRGTHRASRTWILVVHLAMALAGLAGLVAGLWRARTPVLWAILVTVLTQTGVNAFFVAQARHNVRLMPLLIAGGAAGWWLFFAGSRRRRAPREDAPARELDRVEAA